ncbi:FtsK/SpoIIIE domain-containing protein [Actinosynnema sp. NPDC047251]|uniref:Cell division protein, FtsK/SpoIIIE family n=1 Tax=Saccharothrix espanaensis (strain ATCC 51144 / DSM 44229 / JCM 9112 / NBRC 15066 / NRRL 15764) TaxID=1179773 RepID=K0JRE6_SACES|nr:FtsK/SpoIIIE domain-containing protein [Saccharothrix espanaensis]CCH27917.1 Cell division protein, FtsK/SpoIIIE family [Saccharothrix espanaensis DSM 44229]
MIRRDERRRRIEDSFEEFRRAVAAALGNASRELRQLADDRARDMFEVMLRGEGVDRALADPLLAKALRKEAFEQQLARTLIDRVEAFREWSEAGPAQLTALVNAVAPGPASWPPEVWLGRPGTADGSDGVPELWRIGTGVVRGAPEPQSFPVAVPLLDHSHLHVSSVPDSRGAADALVENLLLRLVSYFQPGLVHVHVWDVNQLTGSLPGLYPLTRAGLLTVHDPARLHELLDELSDHIRRVHTGVLVEGHQSVRAVGGRRTEPWRVAVLFGNRQALKEEHQQQLQRVARNGLACGVQLFIVDIPVTVNSPIETVSIAADHTATCTMTGKHVTVELDPQFPQNQVPLACAEIAKKREERRTRLSTFADLLPESLWRESSAAGVVAPVGYDEGEPVHVGLGDTSPHALIGGPSGSGKTNFLYAMLGSLAARYHPDELELYLLDFKEGVSFAQFAPGRKDPTWLPHARLVGVNVNTDREFGVALLRFLADEMRRRADAAKRHEVTKLEQLREEDPEGHWPRIVAVVDEFQYLFGERDQVTQQATQLLEDVARRGRSQGIHLVLSSQDVSGIEGFWGKSAIFEQFTVRIALPKARRVLAEPQNDAAVELPRWHAVVNHESGVRPGNEIARVPDSTGRGTFDRLQAELHARRPAELSEPILFDGSKVPNLHTLPDFQALRPGENPTVLLGQVIDVAGSAAKVRFARTPGRNIAVIGSLPEDAAGVLSGAALSLARQHEPGQATFSLACLAEDAWPYADKLCKQLQNAGHTVELSGLGDIRKLLDSRAARLTAAVKGETGIALDPHYLVVYAVDGAHTLLEKKDDTTRLSGVDSLRTVLKHGPENRTHLLGWWRGPQRLKNSLPPGVYDDIGAWLAFDVQGKELLSFGPEQVMAWSPRPRRGLFFDRFEHSRPQVVIPFDTGEES